MVVMDSGLVAARRPGMTTELDAHYCLYSTEDGEPRYVERSVDDPTQRLNQHIVAALEHHPGDLYDWMRDVWRRDCDVALQFDIDPNDLEFFERYWINQFSNLLNVTDGAGAQKDSPIAQILKKALKEQINRKRGATNCRQPPKRGWRWKQSAANRSLPVI
jgi:hypothetical protein